MGADTLVLFPRALVTQRAYLAHRKQLQLEIQSTYKIYPKNLLLTNHEPPEAKINIFPPKCIDIFNDFLSFEVKI